MASPMIFVIEADRRYATYVGATRCRFRFRWYAAGLARLGGRRDPQLGTILRSACCQRPRQPLAQRDTYIQAMCEAEQAHWRHVVAEQWSGPPSSLISEGFRLLGLHASEAEILAALDGYARAVDGWAEVSPDARETLQLLRERGYRIGLLSNTWWAAEWHNADLDAHGLSGLFDEMVYTSDLPHSKPHPSVFLEVAERLAVEPAACVMVGDRMIDDIGGSLGAGMSGVWKQTDHAWPKAEHIIPTAVVAHLAEVP